MYRHFNNHTPTYMRALTNKRTPTETLTYSTLPHTLPLHTPTHPHRHTPPSPHRPSQKHTHILYTPTHPPPPPSVARQLTSNSQFPQCRISAIDRCGCMRSMRLHCKYKDRMVFVYREVRCDVKPEVGRCATNEGIALSDLSATLRGS